MKTVKDSPFCNTYGVLSLVVAEDGRKYLEMGDCAGRPDYFGPLTDEQVEAFYILCDVQEIDRECIRN